MARQVLTDGTARFFDTSKATMYEEDTDWDGNNQVSCATGSPHVHEALYRTKSGLWVLNHWSQWQGSRESWLEISDTEAAAWLVTNNEDPHPACAEEYKALDLDARDAAAEAKFDYLKDEGELRRE